MMMSRIGSLFALATLSICLLFSTPVHAQQQCGNDADADIVIMIDRTGSLSEADLENEKNAALSLLTFFSTAITPPRVAIGTFNGLCGQCPWWNPNCDAAGDDCQDNAARILPGGELTNNYAQLETVISGISETRGATDLSAAINVAQAQFDAVQTRPHYIVLISDGTPNRPDDNCNSDSPVCDCESADIAAVAAADSAMAAGTDIFGIHFAGNGSGLGCSDEPQAGIDFMRNQIASEPAENFFYEGDADLQGVFMQISDTIVCDDGNACTVDTCNNDTNTCEFTPDSTDSDGDGVSDCEDQCPGGDDTLIGAACDGDDADECRTGVYECATPPGGGRLALLLNGGSQGLVCTDGPELDDADQDGVPDCEDQCTGDDALLGQECDGGDNDSCDGGVYACLEGTVSCNDDAAIDDADQDGVPDCEDQCQGGDDSLLGQMCDGDDNDSCNGGVYVCEGDAVICNDDPALDDSDQDGVPDCEDQCQGGDDTLLGNACDGDDSDVCNGGVYVCEGDAVICTDDPAVDDSDQDGVPDCEDQCTGDDSLLGQACDGDDNDSCNGGVYQCLEGFVLCNDDPEVDDADQDGVPDCEDQCQGADDSLLGMSCDGDDEDICETGIYVCDDATEAVTRGLDGGPVGLICTDDPELDDADGDLVPDCEDQCTGDDSLLGQACDGDDVDACDGGVYACIEGSVLCNDDEALDDADGDGIADCEDECEGDDNLIGELCDGDDEDMCNGGVYECVEGGLSCSDDLALDDVDGDGIPDCEDPNDECPEGEECAFDELLPNACAYANGFFDHINIASVLNRGDVDLNVRVSYRDLFGTEQGAVNDVIQPGLKRDFIVNELGIAPDTYGTVCVETDATEVGQWAGGNIVYKPDFIDGIDGGFGVGRFDYANYYAFSNPRVGPISAPINTFHLGVDPGSTVANWFSLADATPGDGTGLQGEVFYLDSEGSVVNSDPVNLPDGGRFDFDCHVGLGGPLPTDVIGVVRFVPTEASASYLVEMQRYFYDCPLATCANLHTAFVVPRRPATDLALNATVSTVKDEISVIELSNLSDTDTVTADLQVFQEAGTAAGSNMVPIPRFGSRHIVMNQNGPSGFLASGSVGSATVSALDNEKVSALSVFYNVDSGVLQYAYSAPFLAAPTSPQVSEFNSFLGHVNEGELFNTSGANVNAMVRVVDLNNVELVPATPISLDPAASARIVLDLPADTYGTIFVEGDGIVFRNHVIRGNEYTLPFIGR